MNRLLQLLFFWRKEKFLERKVQDYGPFRTAQEPEEPKKPKEKSEWEKKFEFFKLELKEMLRSVGEGLKVLLTASSICLVLYGVFYVYNEVKDREAQREIAELKFKKENGLPIETSTEKEYDEFTVKCYHAGKQILTIEVYGLPLFDRENGKQLVCIGEQCGHCVSVKGHYNYKNNGELSTAEGHSKKVN